MLKLGSNEVHGRLAEERTGIIIYAPSQPQLYSFDVLPKELHFRWPATDVC